MNSFNSLESVSSAAPLGNTLVKDHNVSSSSLELLCIDSCWLSRKLVSWQLYKHMMNT